MLDLAIQNRVLEFIRSFGEDLNSLELLVFFGRHPNVRFNQSAAGQALALAPYDLARALRSLNRRGLVITCNERGNTLYSLTGDASLRFLVLGLLDIDQHQWHLIAGEIIQTSEPI